MTVEVLSIIECLRTFIFLHFIALIALTSRNYSFAMPDDSTRAKYLTRCPCWTRWHPLQVWKSEYFVEKFMSLPSTVLSLQNVPPLLPPNCLIEKTLHNKYFPHPGNTLWTVPFYMKEPLKKVSVSAGSWKFPDHFNFQTIYMIANLGLHYKPPC